MATKEKQKVTIPPKATFYPFLGYLSSIKVVTYIMN